MNGLVPAKLDKYKSANRAVGSAGQPRWSCMGESDSEALGGGGGEGEAPYRMVGVTARVAWSCGGFLGVGDRRRARA